MEVEQNVYGEYPLCSNFYDFSSCMCMNRWYQEFGWIIIEGDNIARKTGDFFNTFEKDNTIHLIHLHPK